MQNVWSVVALRSALLLSVCAATAAADVVVVANRTRGAVEFEIVQAGTARKHRLEQMQSQAIDVIGGATLRVVDKETEPYDLEPNGIYFFAGSGKRMGLEKIGFSTSPEAVASDSSVPGSPTTVKPVAAAAQTTANVPTLRVRVYVDDELSLRNGIQERLATRVRDAGAFLEKTGIARFEVSPVEQWESLDGVTDPEAVLFDFQRKVGLGDVELAIGFSEQVREPRLVSLNGVALQGHIVIPESTMLRSNRERLQILLHAIGHYLGAVHSPERGSIMAPRFSTRSAGPSGLSLDPPNTLVAALVARSLPAGTGPEGLAGLQNPVRAAIRPVFVDLRRAVIDGRVAKRNLAALDGQFVNAAGLLRTTPLARGARTVLQAVVAAAEENAVRVSAASDIAGGARRLEKDELTELYFRAAAEAAAELPPETRARSLGLGLAIAMDKSTLLRTNPLTARIWQSIEPEREFRFRKAVLGEPTMHGRYDQVQHFCVSAGLVALFGSAAAETAGLLKEKADGAFSQADYAADLAGIVFIEHLVKQPEVLDSLASGFRVTDFVPAIDESNNTAAAGTAVMATVRMREEIFGRLQSLPGYAANRRL